MRSPAVRVASPAAVAGLPPFAVVAVVAVVAVASLACAGGPPPGPAPDATPSTAATSAGTTSAGTTSEGTTSDGTTSDGTTSAGTTSSDTRTEEVRSWRASDPTGAYTTGRSNLYVAAGDNGVAVSYDAVFSQAHTCDCRAVVPPGGGALGNGRLVFGDAIRVVAPDGDEVMDCCGEGWGGDELKGPPSPLGRCTVVEERAFFLDADGEPTDAYVVAGDVVEAEPVGDVAVARFVGRRTTAGFLKTSDLACPKDP